MSDTSIPNTVIPSTVDNKKSLKDLVEYFKQHNISFTPAGIWEYDINMKKSPVDAKRYDNLSWNIAKYKNDNMARAKLHNGIIVLDLDGVPSTINENNTITIPSLDITIPVSLYTITSKPKNMHIYYSITEDQQQQIGKKMIKGLYGQKIDILQNYVIFEGHPSPHHHLNQGNIVPLPQPLLDIIVHYIEDEEINIKEKQGNFHLAIHSNPTRSKFINSFLKDKLKKQIEWNHFFRAVFPKEYIKPKAKKLTFDYFTLDYDLMNKIACKLTTTAELDFHSHVVPALHKIVTELGKDPMSRKAQQAWKQILPSLPQHEEIKRYDWADDGKTIEEHINDQSLTPHPLFRTQHMGGVKYIHVDRHSLRPVSHNGEYLMNQAIAQAHHPERELRDEQSGRVIGFDDNVPIVEITKDPFLPPYSIDEHWRHKINLCQPTKFVRNATPQLAPDNLLARLMRSVVHPDYLDIVETYFSHIVFAKSSPIMVMWIATRESELGGTGKSMASITILGKILREQATTISDATMSSGYDISEGLRLLSLEEGSTTGKESKRTYQTIKQLQSPTYTKANAKYGMMETKIIKIAITGSSNQLPALEPSDRRYLCLEPAHLDGTTEPLSPSDAAKLAHFERDASDLFDDIIQEYTDHLYYIYNQEIPTHIEEALYRQAPETIYRKNWVVSSLNNTKTIIYNLPYPQELYSSIHKDRTELMPDLVTALQYLLHMYNINVGKVAVSWEFFTKLIPVVAADPDIDMTKAGIKRMLGDVKLQTGSSWAIELHKKSNKPDWPLEMYTFEITEEAIEGYRELLKNLINPSYNLEEIDSEVNV